MDANQFKSKYVQDVTNMLRDRHQEKNDVFSSGFPNASPKELTVGLPSVNSPSKPGLNIFEDAAKNPQYYPGGLTPMQNIRGGINFVADKIGDSIGQDYSSFINPGRLIRRPR